MWNFEDNNQHLNWTQKQISSQHMRKSRLAQNLWNHGKDSIGGQICQVQSTHLAGCVTKHATVCYCILKMMMDHLYRILLVWEHFNIIRYNCFGTERQNTVLPCKGPKFIIQSLLLDMRVAPAMKAVWKAEKTDVPQSWVWLRVMLDRNNGTDFGWDAGEDEDKDENDDLSYCRCLYSFTVKNFNVRFYCGCSVIDPFTLDNFLSIFFTLNILFLLLLRVLSFCVSCFSCFK